VSKRAQWDTKEIDYFFTRYGLLTWYLSNESNNWRDPKILGPFSSAEESEILKAKLVGVEDLKQNYQENGNPFNRILRWMHN